MFHGACVVSVASSIWSRAREYSYQRSRDGRSIGAQLPLPQRILDARLEAPLLLFVADLEPVLEQDDAAVDRCSFSNSGHNFEECSCCSFVQKPITCSTPARLYQLRSKITISPAAGKCSM